MWNRGRLSGKIGRTAATVGLVSTTLQIRFRGRYAVNLMTINSTQFSVLGAMSLACIGMAACETDTSPGSEWSVQSDARDSSSRDVADVGDAAQDSIDEDVADTGDVRPDADTPGL